MPAFAWNALGHRLIAQIAYDQMTPEARVMAERYNHAMDKVYKPQTLINAATWLDSLRYQDVGWFSTMHYVDFPFSTDGSPLPTLQEVNALWALAKAKILLRNKYATDYDKGVALRVILHIVGDLHQPLHAATRVNASFPKGDHGGNFVLLNHNHVAKNLHAYWDKGGGFLVTRKRPSQLQVEKRAAAIEKRWPCQTKNSDTSPAHWANESYHLAVTIVYKELPKENLPDEKYQNLTKRISEQRIALAGCRLGILLNQIASSVSLKKNGL